MVNRRKKQERGKYKSLNISRMKGAFLEYLVEIQWNIYNKESTSSRHAQVEVLLRHFFYKRKGISYSYYTEVNSNTYQSFFYINFIIVIVHTKLCQLNVYPRSQKRDESVKCHALNHVISVAKKITEDFLHKIYTQKKVQ